VELLDDRNGLTSNIVYAIARDSTGFLWMGTSNGLNIYDGYSFTRYQSLGRQQITGLMYDGRRDALWVVAEDGLYVLEGRRRRLRQVLAKEPQGGMPAREVIKMPDGRVFIMRNHGEILTVDSQYRTRVFSSARSLLKTRPGADVRNMTVFSDSLILFSVNDGSGALPVWQLHTRTGEIGPVSWREKNVMLPLAMRVYGDTLVVSTIGKGVLMLNVNTGSRYDIPQLARVRGKAAADIAALYGQTLYAGFADGRLYRVDLRHTTVEDLNGEVPLLTETYNRHHCIFRDPGGIVWVGTNKGVLKISTRDRPFLKLLQSDAPLSIRGMTEDRAGDYYIGTYRGLYHYEKQKSRWTVYSRMERDSSRPANILPYGVLNDEDSGYIYIASESGFFYRFNKRSGRIETSFYDRRWNDYTLFGYCLYMDEDGMIWIGSSRGLFAYDRRTGVLQPWHKDMPGAGRFSVRHIAGSRDPDVLWLATSEGLLQLHKKKGLMRHLHASSTPALSKNHLNFVSEDPSGRVWVATNGGGFNILSPDHRQVTCLNQEQHGLANDIVYSMQWGDSSHIWISTFNGLSCYDLQTGMFTNYSTTDGLAANEFNHGSYLKDSRGYLHFGTVDGVVCFNPDSLQRYEPPFSLFVSGSSIQDRHLEGAGDTIVMYPSDFSCTIQFGISDYHAPLYNRFLYRIRGWTDDWMPIYGRPELKIPDLPPGDYILEVKGANAYGRPAQNMLVFHLKSRQYFYKTWWFYASLFTIAAGLIWLFFRIRLRNIRKMQQLRVQIASDLHDEVGGLLTRIVLFSDSLSQGGEPEERRKVKLEKIAVLGREATMSMNDILWTIDARNDFSGSLADRMREYAEQMLTPANILLRFDSSGAEDHRHTIPTEVRQNLYVIFKEALNNIVKHSSASEVRIVYRHDRNHFFLSMTNDGNDPEAQQRSSGQGLRNMQMRAEKIGARVQYTRERGMFTLIVEKINSTA
jgi:ligand-binding sensor domain-containing protein